MTYFPYDRIYFNFRTSTICCLGLTATPMKSCSGVWLQFDLENYEKSRALEGLLVYQCESRNFSVIIVFVIVLII
jgi:hypothetical protein